MPKALLKPLQNLQKTLINTLEQKPRFLPDECLTRSGLPSYLSPSRGAVHSGTPPLARSGF